jgi:hypothetical protein
VAVGQHHADTQRAATEQQAAAVPPRALRHSGRKSQIRAICVHPANPYRRQQDALSGSVARIAKADLLSWPEAQVDYQDILINIQTIDVVLCIFIIIHAGFISVSYYFIII